MNFFIKKMKSEREISCDDVSLQPLNSIFFSSLNSISRDLIIVEKVCTIDRRNNPIIRAVVHIPSDFNGFDPIPVFFAVWLDVEGAIIEEIDFNIDISFRIQ